MPTEERNLGDARNKMQEIQKEVLSDAFDSLSTNQLKEKQFLLLETYAKTGRTGVHPEIFRVCDSRTAAKLDGMKAKKRFAISLVVSLIILAVGATNLAMSLTQGSQ